MRDILFRAKDNGVLNGIWQYGSLDISNPDAPTIIRIDRHNNKMFIPILIETVGQYTGLTDKNGKKIFEGDIVEFYFFDKGHKNTKTMFIEWRDSGFCMRELFRDYRLADDFSIIEEKIFTYRGDIRKGVYTTNNTYFVEVIGNIYDNPELLKGE